MGGWPTITRSICFLGRPKLVHVVRNRFTGVVAGAMFTPDWQELPFTIQRYRGAEIARPANLEEIIALAARLSAPFSYMRVDLVHGRSGAPMSES